MKKKNKKEKLVSVVIPVFNSEKTIEKTINSILRQDYKKIEIVIVNDFSNDNSENIIKNIINGLDKKSKIKIKYIKNEKNLGPAATRNIGINNSIGEVIFFTDSDCYIPESWISKIVQEYSSEEIGGVS